MGLFNSFCGLLITSSFSISSGGVRKRDGFLLLVLA